MIKAVLADEYEQYASRAKDTVALLSDDDDDSFVVPSKWRKSRKTFRNCSLSSCRPKRF